MTAALPLAKMAENIANSAYKGVSCLTKTRYHQIQSAVTDEFGDVEASHRLMQRVRDIMRFDPNVSTLTSAHKKHVQAWRERKMRETGKSLYELEGGRRRAQAARTAKPKGTAEGAARDAARVATP